MLSLKSSYRFNSQLPSNYDSTKSAQSQSLTAGVCDYIPHAYFAKHYFSVYIEGVDCPQVVQSILWNQFYQKTLLKQIYAQMSAVHFQHATLVSKLDRMVAKVTQMTHFQPCTDSNQNQIIYIKVHNKIYNLKDKLNFESHPDLYKDLKQHRCLNIQKMSKQGKWKKIYIDFGLYKNKAEFDIVFTAAQHQLDSKHHMQKNIIVEPIDEKMQIQMKKGDKIRRTPKEQGDVVKKQSIKKQIKGSRSVQNSSSKQKQTPSYMTAAKSTSRSKISYPNSVSSSVKNQTNKQNEAKTKQRQNSITKKQNNLVERQQSSIRKSIQSGSMKKGFNIFERTSSDMNILKQINFNSTAKLSNHMSNLNQQEMSLPPTSLDLRRKQKIKVKQNSVMEEGLKKDLANETENRPYADLGKNNSVMAQILSRKEETIQVQRIKLQEAEKRHLRQIQDLKLKHIKQTQTFKTQMSTIFNEYNKKYESQKSQCALLRQQVSSLTQTATDSRVLIAELQLKYKSSEDESLKCQKQSQELKRKVKEMDERFAAIVSETKQQNARLIQEKLQKQQLADKYMQKYNNIYKKMKLFFQQEEN